MAENEGEMKVSEVKDDDFIRFLRISTAIFGQKSGVGTSPRLAVPRSERTGARALFPGGDDALE